MLANLDSSTWSAGFTVLFIILMIWSFIWKGWALWRAARNETLAWYIVLLIVNTLGILEIIYIFGFSGYGKKRP
ncbi:MAG: DUF5652 family protein [Candidatus Berkelbacteria bacterium]|nr:DUF5652 family protein [Candidatus Berkelbacteria bacterium]